MATVKQLLTGLFFSSISYVSMAQVGIGTNTPHASAKLEVSSTNKGFLPPRIALTGTSDVSTISSPATGLFVYNTATAGSSPNNVTPGLYYYDGSKWQRVINQQPDATVTFDKATPTTSGVAFTPNTPASTDYIYVSSVDNSQWTYNGSSYVTYTAPASTAWYTSGGTSDAGSNKTGSIYRTGNVGIGASNPGFPLVVGSGTAVTPIVEGLIVLNATSGTEGGQVTLKPSSNSATMDWTIDQYENSTTPKNPRFRIFAGSVDSNGISISETGKVGMGVSTTGQSEKLYVNGNTKINGNLNAKGEYFATAGLSSDQTVNTTDAVLNLTDMTDLNNWWDGTNHRFQPTIAGYYFVSANVDFKPITSPTTPTHINIQIRMNGNTSKSLTQGEIPTQNNTTISTSAIVYMNGTTDYFDITGYGSQNIVIVGVQTATKLDVFKLN